METMVAGMSRCADDDVFLDGAAEENEEVEELVEPRFRYKRILGDLTRLMESEVASCFAIHEKLLVVGFQSGRICIFDHLGNVNIDSCARNHKCAVTCVAIDDPANYIVSCANDFSIVIFGIGCAEYNQRLSLKTSAKIVAISPDFSRLGSGQRFLAGAQDLVLYERGVRAEFFSGRRRETLLFRGTEKDGLVSAISWHNSLVAFSNESGTRVYDMKSARCVTLIQPVHKIEQFPTAKFPPKLFWLNQQCLAIGWANTLCVCGIVESTERRLSSASTGLFEAPKKYGQILHRFVLPNFAIAGVSFTTRSSYGTEYPLFPPAAISSPPSAANLPTQAQTLKNGMPTLSPPNTDNQLWRELILFGLKCGSSREPSLLGSSNPDQQKNAQTAADHQNVSLADQLSTVSNFCCSNADACSAQLLLIRPLSLQEYSIEAEDSIEMRNVNLKLLHRFSLCSLPMDDIYFILSPREAIEARPCSIDNRINWLMENGLFEEALDSAIRNADSLRDNSVLEVGKRLISHLIERQDFETAAGYLPDVCAKRKEEWMFYVSEFEKQHQVLKLVPVLPTREPQLEPENYESILIAALHSRPKLFHALVTHWDSDIYRAGSILSEVFKRITEDNANKQRPTMGKQKDSEVGTNVLSEQNRVYLLRALASLLLQCRKYDDAIKTYLLIRDQAIFGVIERHKLFPYVKEQIMELMEINQDLAIRLLLDNEDLISHEKVVNLLGNHPRIQLAYLHRLQARGEGSQYADRLVKLYAEHDRASLLPFLRKNEYYRLDLALKTCKKRDFIEEVVYLLGHSGNRLDALDLMVNKMLRIDLAIDFCVENDDPELWERLVESAIKHPEQIAILLGRMASTNIDSLSVVEKIPLQMDIPNLQKCLLQVLLDHEQQRDLLKYSKSVAASDVIGLLKSQLKPMAIIVVDAMGTIIGGQSGDGQQMKCAACHTNLVSASRNDFFLMKDGNMLHQRCYESYNGVNKPSTSTTTYRTKSTESWE